MLYEPLLDGLDLTSSNAVLVMDFSPHLGCNTVAMREIESSMPDLNLYYMSCHLDQKDHTYASARVDGLLARDWFEGRLNHPEIRSERTMPTLPEQRVSKIPGASAAMGNLASVDWKARALINGQLNILEEYLSSFATAPPRYLQQVEKMKKDHDIIFKNMLK